MAFVKTLSTMRSSNSCVNPRQISNHHHHHHKSSQAQQDPSQYNHQQQHQQHHRGFKGLLSRSNVRSHQQQQQPQQQSQHQQSYGSTNNKTTSSGHGGLSSSYAKHPELHPPAREVADDFLPNPKIPDSPSNTPTRKKWEGAYRNFLSRSSKSGSPNTVSSDISSKSHESSSTAVAAAASSKTKNTGNTFSLLPGTKRLVTRTSGGGGPSTSSSLRQSLQRPTTPQSVPDSHRSILPASEIGSRSIPNLPNLTPSTSKHQEDTKSNHHHNGDEASVRGGKFFKAVFSRARSDRSFGSTGTPPGATDELDQRRSKSCNEDELDAAMRRGEGKGTYSPSSVGHNRLRSRGSVGTFISLEESTEDDDDGLDSLLASASSSPHLIMSVGSGVPRCSSTGMIQYPASTTTTTAPSLPSSSSMHHYSTAAAGGGGYNGPHGYALPRRATSANDLERNFQSITEGKIVDHLPPPQQITQPSMSIPDPQPFRSAAAMPPSQQSGLGALLSQQVSNYDELDVRQHNSQQQHHYQYQYNQQPMVPQQPYQQPQPPIRTISNSLDYGDLSMDAALFQHGFVPQPPATLDIMLQDPRFAVHGCSPSSLLTSHQQHMASTTTTTSSSVTNPAMKKAFTEFHNASRFGEDASSAFLGDEASLSMRHDSYVSYHLMMMRGGGSSVPFHETMSERNVMEQVNVSTSLPLETVDEHSISIHKSMRLLKPMQGTDSWEPGRRYLIAPAAMAACPLTVVNKLSGDLCQTASEAAASPCAFGTIDLGECLITYVGEKHHLSLGKWSSCRFELRQNYLLEYDCSAPKMSLPRGFCHLQYAVATKHSDFQDSFELNFYASPCAKADQRVLMVRVLNRDERDHWITCLNRAARLEMTDLWDFDPNLEAGRGRYASVYPARRKNEKTKPGSRYPSLQECDCALKVVDKNQFWRRVVKGKERADTLVREPSVQSTLTAKCGKVSTFLQLRGFFETSDNVVMELELLKGTDLFDHISENGVLSEKEAAEIIRDILTSLEAMNRVGLAHRDVKPANILMCDKKKNGVSVKLGDFGMSTFVGVDGLVRGRCGTPGYVAPEILTAGSRVGYGNRVDVFSAGVTLYVMLCGYEPFYGESEKELIEANKAAKIDFSEGEWSSVSAEARDLVSKMTAFDPRDRLSAKEALEHPWIKKHTETNDSNDNDLSASIRSKNLALSAADTPTEGACLIS